VEVDENMFRLASEVVAGRENVTLLRCDALKNKNRFHPQVLAAVEETLAVNPERRLKLISNLPYSIATPVVSNLVATEWPWVRMVVTIQWELAQRMTARPGEGRYGALAAWLGAQCDVEILRRLGPTVFWPRPQVDSAIIRLLPDPAARARIDDRRFYQDFVRRLFQKRRKLLRPVLAGMYRKQLQKPEVDAILKEMGLEEHARAEELHPPVLVELSNRVHRAIGPSNS
ncbi:MAG: ribosomal RNA small subunit methyltransferase A, partial [Planctomycetaceae bacterium]